MKIRQPFKFRLWRFSLSAIKMQNRTCAILLCLTLLGMVIQVMPFILHPVPSAQVLAVVTLPPNYPADYTAADYARAYAFEQAIFWAGLINTVTIVFALFTWLFSGINERIGAVSMPKTRAWLARVLFLVAICLSLRVIDLPFLYCRFQHVKAFGLSSLTAAAWLKLLLLGLPVPLVLFVLKYLLVICTIPIFKRLWWVAAGAGIFLVFSVAPEFVSRTYPLDPVENLQALGSGPHYDSMKTLLHKAGLDLPIMVVDESRRSKTANICLTGRSGREYVLLTDTFIQQYTPRQVALALAHELGHFQHRTASLLIQKSCGLLILLLSFGLSFVLSGRQALPVSSAPRIIVLTMLCSILVSFAFTPVSLAISRRKERFADCYALQLAGDGEQYGRLLVKVAQHELDPLDLPPWQYYLCASHPTFMERIAQADKK